MATTGDIEKALRPLAFDDFSGQEKIIDNLRVFVEAARMRGEALLTTPCSTQSSGTREDNIVKHSGKTNSAWVSKVTSEFRA